MSSISATVCEGNTDVPMEWLWYVSIGGDIEAMIYLWNIFLQAYAAL
jgi:hypothetical protein